MTIYTLGYSGWTVDEIAACMERLDAVAVDVRMSPRSRNPAFSGKRLRESLGDRYRHVRGFGNINYRGGEIVLQDWAGWLQETLAIISAGRSVVLMCACEDVAVCHRKVVAERLAALEGADVVHLTPADAKPSQTKLF